MRIQVGPTGNLIKGDVLDVSKRALEERLRDIDTQLYMAWNPKKLKGEGCWELRRRPEYKTALPVAKYQGSTFFELGYYETGINHLNDFAYLNYKILEWVRERDLWTKFNYNGRQSNIDQFIKNMDQAQKNKEDSEAAKNRAEMKYGIMQDKKIMRGLKESLLSGINPNLIAKHWK